MTLPQALTIVSHVRHYAHAGQIHAYAAYAREIDIWARLFPTVRIAAPLITAAPPGDTAPMAANVRVIPQRETGGHTLGAKLWQLTMLPAIVWRLWRTLRGADAIHVRCPGNLGLLGALLAPRCARRVVAKYAGQWNGYAGEPLTSRLTRSLLASRWWTGPVTVYGDWPHQPAHVIPFFTSVLSAAQSSEASRIAAGRDFRAPVRVIFVGRLTREKGVDRLLEALPLCPSGIISHVTIVGDGPERAALERRAKDLDVADSVRFLGAVSFDAVLQEYSRHDVVVLLSDTEGWPKALAEAMGFGLIAIGSDSGFVRTMLGDGRGIALADRSPAALAATLVRLVSDPAAARVMQGTAARWAAQYSLDGLENALRTLLQRWWSIEPLAPDAPSARQEMVG